MKKFTLPLLALAAALALMLAACGGTLLPGGVSLADTATLGEIQGTVELRNPDQVVFTPASTGDVLQVGGQVRTGSDGSARLDLDTGTIIRVAADSLFTLESNAVESGSLLTRLVLEAGQVWIMLDGGSVEVETISGTASVRGSYMSVWMDPVTADVWVTCLEGWCQAGNGTGDLEMLAGEGATLYAFDPEGNIPPPPPQLRYLSQQEIDAFLAQNPEAEAIMNDLIATASALPPLDATLTPTPLGSCFELGLPEQGAEVSADGFVQFDWNDQPGVYKYILTVIKPNAAEKSFIAFRSSIQVDALELPLAGDYAWYVTAYDAGIRPICTSATWTFSKPESVYPPEIECFQLTAPDEAAELPETGPLTFSWTELPGRYKYVVTITAPDGTEWNKIVFTNSYTLPAEDLPLAGEYHWQVTAYDASIRPMCASETRTFTKPGSPVPTPDGSGCVTLLSPADGAELDADGPEEFTWSAHPQAYKYLINFKSPGGSTASLIAMTPYHLRYMGSLPEGGEYEWWITVKNSSLNVICTSGHFTFTKPQSTIPTPGGDITFSNRSGPTGNISTCNVYFSVETNPPDGAMVKVIFSTDPVPDGYSDPHYILSHQGGSQYAAGVSLDGMPEGKTIYWRFAIYDGAYTHDATIFSFVSPGCPSGGGEEDTPTVFNSISGPGEVVSAFPVHFTVDASDEQGLQHVKVQYKILDAENNVIADGTYEHLAFNSSSGLWEGDVSFGEPPAGSTVKWWIWAIDDNGKYTYSDMRSFVYTP